MISFVELLNSMALPETAKSHLPIVLENDIQRMLLRSDNPENIITESIDEINHGSVESINDIVRKKLSKSCTTK